MSLSLRSSIHLTEFKMSLISSRKTQNRQLIRMLSFNYGSLTDRDDCLIFFTTSYYVLSATFISQSYELRQVFFVPLKFRIIKY